MKEENLNFEIVIKGFNDEVKNLSRETRKLIYTVYPRVIEVVWIKQRNIGYGTGARKNTEHFAYIMPAKNHVTLGFNYGAILSDPHKILEGKGKLFRHFKIRKETDLTNPHLLEILNEAITVRL